MPIDLNNLNASMVKQSSASPEDAAYQELRDADASSRKAREKTKLIASPAINFSKDAVNTLVDYNKSMYTHPLDTSLGAAKAITAGVVGVGELTIEGFGTIAAYGHGLAKPKSVGQGNMSRTEAAMSNASDFQDFYNEKIQHVHKVMQGITGIQLAAGEDSPKGERAAANLINLIPKALHVPGDTVFEATGNTIAATTTDVLTTWLSFGAPGGVKLLDGVKKLSTGEDFVNPAAKAAAEKTQAKLEAEGIKNPEKFEQFVEEIKKADPELAEHLEQRHKANEAKGEEIVGRDQAKEEIAAESGVKKDTVKLYRGVPKDATGETVGGALHYTEMDSVAEKFAGEGGKVEEQNVTFNNRLDAPRHSDIKKQLGLPKTASHKEVIEEARKQGYDGLSFSSTNGKEYVHIPNIKNSTEIKPDKGGYTLYVNGKPSTWHKTLDEAKTEAAATDKFMASLTSDQISAHVRATMLEGYQSLEQAQIDPNKPDPIMYMDNGQAVTRAAVARAFEVGSKVVDKTPGVGILKGKLSEYYEEAIRLVNPEALGPSAKLGASVLAKNIAEQMQKDSSFYYRAKERQAFWNHRVEESQDFINNFERGKKFEDPTLNAAADAYRNWNKDIYETEQKAGINYEPEENYLYHTFEDSKGVSQFFEKRFGPKWNNPGFIKDRSFDMYSQAIKAGFKPKYTNPEDIMLARQHASDSALMKVQTLSDLEKYGLATRVTKGQETSPSDFPSVQWRSPNGTRYWVDANASAVLHNHFETKGLWDKKGMAGDAFRGAMALKNTMVPIKLAMSLFHPIHVATIDNATAMVRSSKELLSGKSNPAKWLKDITGAALYKDFINNPKMGSKILKAYQGKIKDADLTAADKQSLQFMAEGGLIPEMSAQYKTKAIDNFKKAVQQRSAKAVFHAPFAAISAIQKPLFEVWIPSLKVASYLNDVKTALKVDPSLMDNSAKRLMTFRQLAKSVDNRYGEMAYNTLFMDKMVKDLAVANTLSLGWQMGFLREYGGGMMDIGQAAAKEGSLATKAKSGMLDRPLFISFYTAQALAYGGLLTWALTKKQPQDLMDYVYPKNGEQNEKGEDQRVSTMFYPKEFMAVYKHMQNQGVVSGLDNLIESKSSGLIGMASEWAKGVNSYGQEIRDPNAPAYKKIEQTLAATLADLEPISLQSIEKQGGGMKAAALSVAGFSAAPQYITEPKTEGAIKSTFQKYYGTKLTPYEKVEYSADARKLQQYYNKGDMDKYSTLLDNMIDKYDLTAKEQAKLYKNAMSGKDQILSMFERMTWQQQKKLLDDMSDEEREYYLPHANKDHLRFKYEAP